MRVSFYGLVSDQHLKILLVTGVFKSCVLLVLVLLSMLHV
jgi:hypothetical protein